MLRRPAFWDGGRNLVHADGKPALLVADTAWALPWRATEEHCRVYAADRRAKGFNAVLLMSVQPDMHAQGPRDRTVDEGFGVGFEDLPDGHINQLNPAYFQYLDRLTAILVEYEIVPVLQPVFQGFGWKGLSVAGTVVPPAEYARYCRYLVARYGARPMISLVGADGSGYEPQIPAEGAGWREALDFEGSRYPGLMSRILDGLPFIDMQPNWQVTLGRRGLLVPGRLFIGYAEEGGPLMMFGDEVPLRYRVLDPRTGEVLHEGTRASATEWIPDDGGGPRVYICCDKT